MTLFIDARIPVVFGVEPGGTDAILLTDAAWQQAHPIGCACCVARGPAAGALDQLFLDRVRGNVAWFTRVVVPSDPDGLVQAALADPVVAARFRAG
jgi:hypothetical protein